MGSQDSLFNASFCWLSPSPPFSSRPLPKYLTSWGVAPPLIISPGLPRYSSAPAEDGSSAQNVTIAAAGGPAEKARSSLRGYCHPSASSQARPLLLEATVLSLWAQMEEEVSGQKGVLGTHSLSQRRDCSAQSQGILVRAYCQNAP